MIIYGKSGATFAKDLYYDPSGKIPGKTSDWEKAKKEGFKLVDHFLGTFTGLRNWIEQTKKFAQKYGYVETMFGRRRRLPDLKSKVAALQAGAERQAINAPIQGTGSDLTLLSLVHINNFLKKEHFKSLIIATVHDSIVFDIYIPELPVLAKMIKQIMESVHKPYIATKVPILAELELGINYGNTVETDLNTCTAITDHHKFHDWYHAQSLIKYQKEIEYLKKSGLSLDQIKQYLIKYNRPINELVLN